MPILLNTASVFGELWRLEPLPMKRRTMWRREMEWILSVSDHIVELVPSWQRYSDGSTMEVWGFLRLDRLFLSKTSISMIHIVFRSQAKHLISPVIAHFVLKLNAKLVVLPQLKFCREVVNDSVILICR